jgi:hypothetical protein
LLHVHASLTTANKYSREGTNQLRSKLNLHRSTKARFFLHEFHMSYECRGTTRIVGGSRNCPTVDHLVFAKDCCCETTLHMFIPCFHRWPWTKPLKHIYKHSQAVLLCMYRRLGQKWIAKRF